ncbi:MAG: hypothetical protein IT245_06810 [Bacteroidia bacterium]|nr:hypothetical protein [Bacteroidia bacterium]
MHPGLDCQVCNNCRIIDTVTGRPPRKELVDFKKADEVDNTIHIWADYYIDINVIELEYFL